MFELVPELPEQPQPVARESEIRRAYERGRAGFVWAFWIGVGAGTCLGVWLGLAIALWVR